MEEKESVQPASRAEWRDWLAAQHRTSAGVWLITWKRRTGKPTVQYEEAVEEALCFGWIDGVLNRVDDERSKQWFAPRKSRGTWARSNKERVVRLEAAGLMTDAAPKLFDTGLRLHRALDLSLRYRMSLRDCLYLALAIEHDCPFLTADRRLFRAGAALHPALRLIQ